MMMMMMMKDFRHKVSFAFYCLKLHPLYLFSSRRIAVSTGASHAPDPGSIPGESILPLLHAITTFFCFYYA